MKRGNGLEGAPLEGAPDQRGWSVKHGNNLGGVVPDGARPERRLSVDGLCSVEIDWGELCWRDGSAGLAWPPLEGARRERRTSAHGL